MLNIRIHGTYPYDGGKWGANEQISLEKVADLLGVEVTPEQIRKSEQGDEYLWLNKGFVLVDRPDLTAIEGPGNLQLACMAMLGGSPEIKGIKSGDRAVYLHDGTYYLITRK